MLHLNKITFFAFCVYILFAFSCTQETTISKNQKELFELLEKEKDNSQTSFSIINQIADSFRYQGDNQSLILFLTDFVEKNPDNPYNSYWLLLTAYTYMQENADSVAEYYFDRIIQNYDDLLVKGKSVHVLCLQNLIQISTSSDNRIYYFNQLITRFPDEVNITELYMRLAIEYEKIGDWEQALYTYSLFLERPDATTIQIPGIPDAYNKARKLIDFNNSPKDWTFESLESLEKAVKNAISRYSSTLLDKYRSKVNFFAMSWKQEETDTNSQKNFSMKDYMRGNRIRYSAKLDESSNPNEAYLRTTGWSQYINVWYLYFRKVNFPLDPEIHGRWEWAGIYFGEKL
ncbi:MAG: tetratricopeptide repeat protein [Spirochaetaceae bacterium]|nr:tetratricopeptide repeat protein [Spirochaetaceae bacterium]MBQ7904210.1 tetratricopeptide repeat protein [Spirochaetaceae bacterium]